MLSRHPSAPRPAKLNWKVVWCVEGTLARGGEFQIRRCVFGRREARAAWALFWRLRGQPWVVFGPELWRGRERVL